MARVAWGSAAMIVAATAGGLLAARAPAAVADAADSAFSAGRAFAHVERIAARAHPTGSRANVEVREYLARTLVDLGFTVEPQRGQAARRDGTPVELHNIVATRAGSAPTGAVFLMAHHDAARQAPGAGDDAAGVAAILETVRAIGRAPLRNDLVVLLTDGEELGLLGAELFVTHHPLASRHPAIVLNFEARGNAGPSFLFQTSPGNGRLIATAARVVRHPQANSLTGEVYRRLPNDTDLSVFLRERPAMHALNFAFIDGFGAYHTVGDTPGNLSIASLQHHGEWALPLTRAFGNGDLGTLEASDATYATLPLLGLVWHPASWSLPMAVALLLSVLALAARGGVTLAGTAWSLGAALAAVSGGFGIGFLVWWGVESSRGPVALQDPVATSTLLFTATMAIVVVVAVALFARIAPRVTRLELGTGVVLPWVAAALATAAWMPGASFLFTWPLAPVLTALAVLARRPGTRWSSLLLAVAAVPMAVILPPIIANLQVAMTNHALAACGAAAALAVTLTAPALVVTRGEAA